MILMPPINFVKSLKMSSGQTSNENLAIDAENLNCSVCLEIVENNRECMACGAIFCFDCIKKWVDTKHSCPMCKKTSLNITHALDDSSFRKNQFVERLANGIIMNCPLNCGMKVSRGDIKEHCNRFCINRPTLCDCVRFGCKWTGPYQQLEKHVNTCKFVVLKSELEINYLERKEIEARLLLFSSNGPRYYYKKAKEVSVPVSLSSYDTIENETFLFSLLDQCMMLLKAVCLNKENAISKFDLYMDFKNSIDVMIKIVNIKKEVFWPDLMGKLRLLIEGSLTRLFKMYALDIPEVVPGQKITDSTSESVSLPDLIMYLIIRAWLFDAEGSDVVKVVQDFATVQKIFSKQKQAFDNKVQFGIIPITEEARILFSFAFFSCGRFAQLKLRNMDMAIEQYSLSISQDYEFSTCYNNRGICYQSTGMYEAAFSDFSSCLTLEPTYAKAMVNRGILHQKLYDNEANALRDFSRAIEIDQTNPKAYFHRAMILEKKGDLFQAFDDYKKAYELDKTNTIAQLKVQSFESIYKSNYYDEMASPRYRKAKTSRFTDNTGSSVDSPTTPTRSPQTPNSPRMNPSPQSNMNKRLSGIFSKMFNK